MKLKSRFAMILLLTGMLLLTLIGGITRKKDDSEVVPQTDPVDVIDDVMPDSFKGTVEDPYNVPAEVMNVIVSYLDGYYRSLYTLEKQDLSSLFENEYIAAVSEKAIDLQIETRKLYDFDFTLKLLIVGDSSVGKTNFVHRFIEDKFNKNYMTTSGVDLKTKDLEIKNKKIRIQIWDTAGQEKYKAITKNLFLRVMGALIIYDITNQKSYNILKQWVKMIKEECPHMQIIIIGNKSDLEDERAISQDEVMDYVKEEKVEYIETSCLTGENVKKSVITLCEKILEKKDNGPEISFMLDNSVDIPKKKKCC